jgi:hypothetical protein
MSKPVDGKGEGVGLRKEKLDRVSVKNYIK